MAEFENINLGNTQPCAPNVQAVNVTPQPSVYSATGAVAHTNIQNNCNPCGTYGGAYYINNCGVPLVSGQSINYQTTQLQAAPSALPDDIPATNVLFSFAGNIAPIAPTVENVDEALLWIETEVINRFRHDLLTAADRYSFAYVDTLGELAYATIETVLADAIAWTGTNQVLVWDGATLTPTDFTQPAETFIALTDTPVNYIAGAPLTVDPTGTAIEYAVGSCLVPCPPNGNNLVLSTDGAGGINWQTAAAGVLGNSSFLALNDTPQTYVNQSGKYVSVNTTEDGVIFVDPPTGTLPDLPNDGECYVLTTCGSDPCNDGSNTAYWTEGCVMPCPPTDSTGYVLTVVDPTTNAVEWQTSNATGTFVGLTDTPSEFGTNAGRSVVVNAAGDALVFSDCDPIPCPPTETEGEYVALSTNGGTVDWITAGSILSSLVFFRAIATQDQTITGSVPTDILFTQLELPIDTNYDSTSGRYAITVYGRYLVTVAVYLQIEIENNHGGNDGRFAITLSVAESSPNSAADVLYRLSEQTFVADGEYNVVTLSGSTYLQLDANSSIRVVVSSSPVGQNDAAFSADFGTQSFTLRAQPTAAGSPGLSQINIQQIVAF